MPELKEIVINTSPLLAIIAASGNLEILRKLYKKVYVPFEVHEEILKGGITGFGIKEFERAKFLNIQAQPTNISNLLMNLLDKGEASVIQLAIDKNIRTVCIDERTGRRIARLNNLLVTGAIGILLNAKKHGFIGSIRSAIDNMRAKGIFLSQNVIDFALKNAKED